MTTGQTYTVRGTGFNKLPDDLVIAPSSSYAINETGNYKIIPMTSKTDTEMKFTALQEHQFVYDTRYTYLAAPASPPRELIEYELHNYRDASKIRTIITTDNSDTTTDSLLCF